MSTGSGSERPPNKRLKTDAPDVDDDGGGGDNEAVYCGICYADGGSSIAGEIDSCSHHFCFACIMEWAKHESRCPICRQRFSNVRRLAKHGVFSFSRDVKVPLRDQVYHPYGNMTTGPADSSIAEAKCSVCHGVTDENLLLLCDLCNAASHSYCVGLGYTVPEGDWFCYDCAVSRETNADEESGQQNAAPSVRIRPVAPSPTPSQQILRPPPPPPVIPSADRLSRYNKGKRPLSGVQQVQCNIQALRDNWNNLRSGSMKFRSGSIQAGGVGGRDSIQMGGIVGRGSNQIGGVVGHGSIQTGGIVGRGSVQTGGIGGHERDSSAASRSRPDEPRSVTSTSSNRQSSAQGSPSMLKESGSKEVEKAWKMMDKAKKMQPIHRRTSRQ